MSTHQVICTAALVAMFIGVAKLLHNDKNISRKHKKNRAIYAHDFIDQWPLYRKADPTPGCYVILIYKKRPSARQIKLAKNYDEVYVGQSVNLYTRVYKHLTGYGNGDVYADMKRGRFIYLRFVTCARTQLNQTEIELISKYNATRSYNKTKGGSRLTCPREVKSKS